MTTITTRFAPSPTGYLHIGGARTAIYNWLYARKNNGKFLLRIEDTDKARSKDEYLTEILASLKWLGLDWDGEPVFQSKRNNIYQQYLQKLIDNDFAYKCYCTKEELEIRKKKNPKYDRKCRSRKTNDEQRTTNFVYRFKMPLEGEVNVNDQVKGQVQFQNENLDDFIIQRTDGSFTYNFVVVVDDIDMGLTHVCRGDDHLNNTPKQINLYQAFEAKIPEFAHFPLILGQDKAPLSKRHGATSIKAYKEAGYLPEALVNFLVRLGWSLGDEEIISIETMLKEFEITNVGKSAGVFNKEKLDWLNGHYIRQQGPGDLLDLIKDKILDLNSRYLDNPNALKLIDLAKLRTKDLNELAKLCQFFFSDTLVKDEKSWKKYLNNNILEPISKLKLELENLQNFTEKNIEAIFDKIINDFGVKKKNLAQAVRCALTGLPVSPGIYEVIEILGNERAIARIAAGINHIKA